MKNLVLSIFVIVSRFVLFTANNKYIKADEGNEVIEMVIDQDVISDLEDLNFNPNMGEYDKDELINLSVGAFNETTLDDGINFKNTRKSNAVKERESVSLLSINDEEIVKNLVIYNIQLKYIAEEEIASEITYDLDRDKELINYEFSYDDTTNCVSEGLEFKIIYNDDFENPHVINIGEVLLLV